MTGNEGGLVLTMSEGPDGNGLTATVGYAEGSVLFSSVVKNERSALLWYERMKKQRPWEKTN